MIRAFFAGALFGMVLAFGIVALAWRRAGRRMWKGWDPRAVAHLKEEAKRQVPVKHLRDVDTTDLRRGAIVFVQSTEQYFSWEPNSILTVDGVLVLATTRRPALGRFVLDQQPWEPWEAVRTAEAL